MKKVFCDLCGTAIDVTGAVAFEDAPGNQWSESESLMAIERVDAPELGERDNWPIQLTVLVQAKKAILDGGPYRPDLCRECLLKLVERALEKAKESDPTEADGSQ